MPSKYLKTTNESNLKTVLTFIVGYWVGHENGFSDRFIYFVEILIFDDV